MSEEVEKQIVPVDLIAPENFIAEWRPNQTEEEYHADKSAVGSGSIRLMLSSPKTFFAGHFGGRERAATNDMRLGRIIHMALLEPERFQESFVVMPEFWGLTGKGERTNSLNCTDVKNKRAAWLADRKPGAVVVTEEELEQIIGMVDGVRAHPQGPHIFTHGVMEQSGYYRDPKTGIRCKIKPDFRGNDLFLVTEFKSAQSSAQKMFGAKAFGDLRYDIQLWMYAYGTSIIENKPMPDNLFFMVSEKSWPHECGVYFMTDEQKNQARYDYERAMSRLLKCIQTDVWPQRQNKMEPLWTPKFFIDNDVDQHERELQDAGI